MNKLDILKKDNNINVFIAAGSKLPKDKDLIKEVAYLGEYLAKAGYTLVQGGSARGLMGTAYNHFVKYSKDVVINFWDIFDDDLSEFVGIKKAHSSLNIRLENFLNDSDVLVVLPGANGTLHEFCTFFEYARYDKTRYKIILVNYKGFYDGLIAQIRRQEEDCFYKEPVFDNRVTVVSNVEEAIKAIPKNERLKK